MFFSIWCPTCFYWGNGFLKNWSRIYFNNGKCDKYNTKSILIQMSSSVIMWNLYTSQFYKFAHFLVLNQIPGLKQNSCLSFLLELEEKFHSHFQRFFIRGLRLGPPDSCLLNMLLEFLTLVCLLEDSPRAVFMVSELQSWTYYSRSVQGNERASWSIKGPILDLARSPTGEVTTAIECSRCDRANNFESHLSIVFLLIC
jgi:hypothetical protein